MPKYMNEGQDTTLWNFYITKKDKANFINSLVSNGHFRAQAAAIRALIYLYVNDSDVAEKVHDNIDNFIVYKKNGDISIN